MDIDFEQFLEELKDISTEDPKEFELQSIKKFDEYVDVESWNLYFQPSFREHGADFRPDAMIAKSRDGKPLFIVESKMTLAEEIDRIRHDWIQTLSSYLEVTGADYAILLSNSIFSIIGDDNRIDIELEEPGQEAVERVIDLLNSVEVGDEKRQLYNQPPSEQITAEYFSLNTANFEEAVSRLDEADSTHEKGEAFEDLAGMLFGGIEFLEVRDKQLRTNTGEIDVVVEYQGYGEKTIFDEYSRFIIAECKNWSDIVGVPQIRDFKGKMDKSYTDFGVIFAREGISGDEGADAIRWIHDYFQREGSVIIVIDDDEIARLKSGEGFYDILDELLYQRRFDLSF